MFNKLLGNHYRHRTKVLAFCKSVIGTRYDFQSCVTSDGVDEPSALMERHQFIAASLDDQCRRLYRFGRFVGVIRQAVFVEMVFQRYRSWAAGHIWNFITLFPMRHSFVA